jgi:sulfite reductase alpha subunit-like flavoprotein
MTNIPKGNKYIQICVITFLLFLSSIDGSFIPWTLRLRQTLLDLYPLPEGTSPIPDDVLFEPKWVLTFADQQNQHIGNGETDSTHATPTPKHESASDHPPLDLLQIPRGVTATVISNHRMTPDTHWQDVRHLTVTLSEPQSYSPGDVLTIYPKNFPIDTDALLALQNWTSIADTPVRFTPTQPLTPSYPHAPIPLDVPLTLRKLLTNHLDIMSIPRRSFFAQLAHYTTDEFHMERLKEFTDPQYIDELYDYTTRPRRSILEVLDEFTSVRIPWQKICSIIPLMRGRQFSIASGGILKSSRSSAEEAQTKVELLIALVKYKTIIKRIRQGVCTRYVATLKSGQDITVTLQKGALKPRRGDISKPVVMVGPGTGVAPMRSLIHERKMWREEAGLQSCDLESGGDTLFFGCRNAESDYLFKDEWPNIPGLAVFAAFSRDQVCPSHS